MSIVLLSTLFFKLLKMSLYYNIIKINFIVGAMKSSHRVGNFIHCLHTVDQKASLVQQNKTLSVLAPNV